MAFIKFSSIASSLFLAFAGGMLYASGFPMFNASSFVLGPLLGFIFLNAALKRESTELKKQMAVAIAYSFGFYLLGFYWIPHTLLEFGGLVFPFNHALGWLFAFFIIPQVYLYTLLQKKISSIVLLCLGYVLLEQLTPQQFPAHLGHSLMSLAPNIQLPFAPLMGSAGYSFMTAYLALILLTSWQKRKAPVFHCGVFFLMLMAHLTFSVNKQRQETQHLMIRLVQPNIGNFIKIGSEKGELNSLNQVFERYIALSTAQSSRPIELIIWPETAFPSLISSELMKANPSLKAPETISRIIDITGAEMFLGGYDIKPSIGVDDYQSQFNSAFHFSASQELKGVYRKMRLIPFGEGLPFGPLNKTLSKVITNISFFAEGDSYTLFKTKNGYPFISAICYEILFPDFIRDFLNASKEEPQFLINLTNDSWYGDTAEPHQHLFLAKWRALEFNLPIIRSTNTGITTVIYPDGSESARLNFNDIKFIDIDFSFNKRESTVYQKFGLWPLSALALLIYALERVFNSLKQNPLLRVREGE